MFWQIFDASILGKTWRIGLRFDLSTHLHSLSSTLLRLDVQKPKWRQEHRGNHRPLRPEVSRRCCQHLLRVGGRNEDASVEGLPTASRVLRGQPLQRLKRLSLLHQVPILPTHYFCNWFKKLDCFSGLRNSQVFWNSRQYNLFVCSFPEPFTSTFGVHCWKSKRIWLH